MHRHFGSRIANLRGIFLTILIIMQTKFFYILHIGFVSATQGVASMISRSMLSVYMYMFPVIQTGVLIVLLYGLVDALRKKERLV